MNMRLAAVLAIPCLCLAAAPADAQSRGGNRARAPIQFDLRQLPAPVQREVVRYREMQAPPVETVAVLESWSMGRSAMQLGVGRYSVPDYPRPRTHTERMRDTGMEPARRSIAGASLNMPF